MLALFSAIALTAAYAAPVPEGSILNDPDRGWQLEPAVELGFLAPLSHKIQFGRDGTYFNYIQDGGQDNLFFVTRWSLDLRIDRHTVTVLYQPLTLKTSTEVTRPLVFDNVRFGKGGGLESVYGFDFYRGSWTWDLLPDDDAELGLGASLQIRNATIGFTSADGEQRTTNRDIGPVPIIKLRGRWDGEVGFWGFEADGFYAPIKYINGGNSDVVGAIADLSIRAGLKANRGVEPFLNLRYLGGGAEGTSSNPDPGKDGYVRNWLHFATLTVGAYVR
ncbi:MAG: hypothetical protein ACI8PZ_005284 [Myxococcota bacterium]|jgi:hypothetical protein